MSHHARITLALLVVAFALLILTPNAGAASYWVNLAAARGEIAPGVNGFTAHMHGGGWNQYGSHCQAEPGAYVAGSYCRIRFNVPAGLSAGAASSGGIARGQYRTANVYAQLRSERPGGAPAGVTDSDGDGAFNHGWQVLGSYVDVGLRFTTATTTTAATNWFHIDTFDILLHDPSAPTIAHVQAGAGGWNGPGCLPHSYAWADTGSQVKAMQVINLTTGAHVDSWAVAATGPTSGYAAATDTGCTAAPGTGTYAYRTTATDRSGNTAAYDYALTFDATAPTVSAPVLEAEPLLDGAVISSRHGYRPTVRWTGVGDAHSGIGSVTVTLDGAPIGFTRAGSEVTLAPAAHLPLGTRSLRLTIIDAVGNATSVERSIIVRDDVSPVLTVASPSSAGASEPVLDVSAVDDHAGLDSSTWTVRVNGATLVASSNNHRLQANIGLLVDGTHEIVVTVTDRAGNVGRATVRYVADSGDGLPDPPGLNGLYLLDSPARVEEGSTHHVRAIAVRAGRPVSGRVELRRGPLVLAGADVASSGAVDVIATLEVAGPLLLHAPAGSGLEPVEVAYQFVPRPSDPCAVQPRPVSCEAPAPIPPQAPTNTTTNTTNNITNAAPAPAASTGGGSSTPSDADARNGYPRDTVYYINGVPHWNGLPLAESGARLDRVAPTWRLTLAQQPAGTVRRTRRIVLRLWTSEMAVLALQPAGSTKRTTVNPRRVWRTVHVLVGARTALGRKLARARSGSLVTVRITVAATDKNENRSKPRTITYRVRV